MKLYVRISGRIFIIVLLSISSIVGAQRKRDFWEENRVLMPTKRVEFATSVVNGKIYAIGVQFSQAGCVQT